MDSSTSHSDKWFPSRAAMLLLVTATSWVGCAIYSVYFNPEVTHYAQGAAIKNSWTEKMTREYGQKNLIFGGSSCEFSIDGERMLTEHHLPMVNYGRSAGIGACVLAESVLEHVRPGDVLIVSLEPEVLTERLYQPSLGVQFSFAMHHPEWVIEPVLGIARLGWFQAATSLRPGGYHFFTMIGKLLRGQPLYRYQLSDYRASGWKQTAVRRPIGGLARPADLSPESIVLLRRLRKWCDEHDVRAAYALPWSYAPPVKVQEFQKQNVQFLLEMAEFFPVLKDPHLGADPVIEHFSDTPFHPNNAGAALHTDELADQIKNWDVWTAEELQSLESRL